MSQNPSPIRPQQIDATPAIGDENEEMAPANTPFSSYMQNNPQTATTQNSMPSPFDLPQKTSPVVPNGPTTETLLAQVNQAQSTLGDINNQLNYPNLKLKSSQKYLLKNKLTDASNLLRTANTRMGVNPGDPPDLSAQNGPLGKFLSLISDGTQQIASAKDHIQKIGQDGTSINPADMLLIQIKLNKAQQELEFSSVLLSKAVDDLKQLMNTQI